MNMFTIPSIRVMGPGTVNFTTARLPTMSAALFHSLWALGPAFSLTADLYIEYRLQSYKKSWT